MLRARGLLNKGKLNVARASGKFNQEDWQSNAANIGVAEQVDCVSKFWQLSPQEGLTECCYEHRCCCTEAACVWQVQPGRFDSGSLLSRVTLSATAAGRSDMSAFQL